MSTDPNLQRARESHQWFAPSMFITNYGRWGTKIEVSAYKHNPDGSIETLGFNIDGSSYYDAKRKFWVEWNLTTNRQKLSILKAVGAYGL